MQKILPTPHPAAPVIPSGKKDLYKVYLGTLFFALHYVLIIYINSTFLEQFLSKTWVGILYAEGSLLGIILLSYGPHFLRRLGNRAFMIILAIIQMASLLTLGTSDNMYLVIGAFILQHAIVPTLFFNFDLFIEHYSAHEETGKARGTFLSIINVVFVAVPLVSGIIITQTSLSFIYVLSTLCLIPLVIMVYSLAFFRDAEYKDQNILASVKQAWKVPDLRNILFVNLILQMFYAVMVIYMPIYLHDVVGFDWQDIGLIFTVMLTPFVLFELPLGRLSDTLTGEKEILIIGICIMALATTSISFIAATTVVVWAAILFMTRMGASFVEIMSESYFFKKISDEDTNFLSLWRALAGVSYTVIPAVMGLLLLVLDIRNIFILLGALCASGLFFAARITDTL